MTFFLCKLWPYLAGGLIGWLLAGWLARRLKHSEPPVERIVEKHVDKIVDNPEHLALIGKLEGENSQLEVLRSRINRFLEAKENSVDKAEYVALVSQLEEEKNQISSLKSKISDLKSQKPQVIEKEIEKTVEVDNPKLLARIKELELEDAKAKVIEKEVEKLVDNPDHLKRISELEEKVATYKQGLAIDLKAARAAGIAIKSENDFTAIEGIGPKINDLIQADGIQTFSSLAGSDPSVIQKTLDNAGSSFAMANPGTWPDQAHLAANNRWPALKALQDVLDGGVYPDGNSSKGTGSGGKSKNEVSEKAPELDIAAAKAAGFNIKQKNNGQDDFTLIEGIGPKINELIHNEDIHTFPELGRTKVEVIQEILDKAGPSFKLAKPGTWPAQADMAAANKWEALKAWQDELDGGE